MHKLSNEERRRQLLDTALVIVREEGADRLTLGRLAARAGVSKPLAYDHFRTRSGLLIELYKSIDTAQLNALRNALSICDRSLEEISHILAAAYIHCSADPSGDWHKVGAALAGSKEKDEVYQELLDGYIQFFISVLKPYSTVSRAELERRCVGLVGAGEAISAAMVRGGCSELEATQAFTALIQGGLSRPGNEAFERPGGGTTPAN